MRKHKRLLIHIGTGKTGSSSIQETLHRDENRGLLGPIGYPTTKEPCQNLLAAVYMPADRMPRIYRGRHERNASQFAKDVRRFRSAVFAALDRHDRVLLSGEYLAQFVKDEVEAFAHDLRAAGVADVRVLAYIREPASLYLSGIQQRLKGANHLVPPARYRYPYLHPLTAWGSVFPDMVVRPFDRELLRHHDVIDDFVHEVSAFLGYEIDPTALVRVVANESLSAEAMLVLRSYRRRFHASQDNVMKPDSSKLRRILENSTAAIPQSKPRLVKSAATFVRQQHADQLDVIAAQYGVDLRGTADSAEHTSIDWRAKARVELEEVLEEVDPQIAEELLWYCLNRMLVQNTETDLASR